MTDSDIIREKIGIGEVLAQLAEEATELAQAALKYRRVITGTNPTPVSKEEALEHLREEIADVDLCLVIAGDLCEEADNELFRMEAKRARWIERLGEKPEPEEVIQQGIPYRPTDRLIGSMFFKVKDNGDGTFTAEKKPDCNGECANAGHTCPHLLPDFGCEYDGEEAKA